MRFLRFLSGLFLLSCLLATLLACNSSNPDDIRRRTAEATENMRRDSKAVVDGVKEGMGHDRTVDINHASHDDLLALPGMTEHDADRIISNRPFDSADDLVRRRVISGAEYDKIRDRVVADR